MSKRACQSHLGTLLIHISSGQALLHKIADTCIFPPVPKPTHPNQLRLFTNTASQQNSTAAQQTLQQQ